MIHVGVPNDGVVAVLERGGMQVTHVATPDELRAQLANPVDAVVWSRPSEHEAIVEAIGASCVHQLGNYIGAVLAYIELVSRAELDDEVRSDVDRMREAALEAARALRAPRRP